MVCKIYTYQLILPPPPPPLLLASLPHSFTSTLIHSHFLFILSFFPVFQSKSTSTAVIQSTTSGKPHTPILAIYLSISLSAINYTFKQYRSIIFLSCNNNNSCHCGYITNTGTTATNICSLCKEEGTLVW